MTSGRTSIGCPAFSSSRKQSTVTRAESAKRVHVREDMMAQMDDGNVQAIRNIDDEAALAWLRAQPGGRTKLSDEELGGRWGWKRQRFGRRVKAWAKEGSISRRGNTITYADLGAVVPAPVPPPVPSAVPPLVPSVVPPRAVKDVQPAALPPLAPEIHARAPGQRHARRIRFAALIAALALATVSGGFSITGMTSIFVGAFGPVIGMGIALEAGKLSAVAWLGHQRGTASKPLRAALALLVAVLMGLNAIGCYGFLAKAHIGHQVGGDGAVAGRAADITRRPLLCKSTKSPTST